MAIESTDIFMAARLIQWGLQPKVRPVQQQEYRDLVREYLNRSEFQMIVQEMADGLGLYVLNVTEHGIVLSPREESIFRMKTTEFRPTNSSTDTRLLDGLVEVTIAATVFPRERDLDDDINRPRPPVTVDEVEEQLRSLCDKLSEQFKEIDPAADDLETGLYDAWRVYANTTASRETKDNRQASRTTRRIIEYNLERLKDFGCFTETRYNGKTAWQPTRRYNVLVQELAAFRLFSEVTDILNRDKAPVSEDDADKQAADLPENFDEAAFNGETWADQEETAVSDDAFSDGEDGFDEDRVSAASDFDFDEDEERPEVDDEEKTDDEDEDSDDNSDDEDEDSDDDFDDDEDEDDFDDDEDEDDFDDDEDEDDFDDDEDEDDFDDDDEDDAPDDEE